MTNRQSVAATKASRRTLLKSGLAIIQNAAELLTDHEDRMAGVQWRRMSARLNSSKVGAVCLFLPRAASRIRFEHLPAKIKRVLRKVGNDEPFYSARVFPGRDFTRR